MPHNIYLIYLYKRQLKITAKFFETAGLKQNILGKLEILLFLNRKFK